MTMARQWIEAEREAWGSQEDTMRELEEKIREKQRVTALCQEYVLKCQAEGHA